MPPGFEFHNLGVELAVEATPAHFDIQLRVRADISKPKVQFLTPFSRMPTSTVNLGNEPSPARQADGSLGADCGPASGISFGIFRQELRLGSRVSVYGQKQ